VKLWVAGHQAAYLRSDASWKDKYASVCDFINTHDDWIEAFVIWYDDEPRIGASWFNSRAPEYFGVHVEEWLELTKDTPIVPLISSESHDVDSNWSIDDAYTILSSLHERDLHGIVNELSQSEAYLLWQVALGESPPISRRHMLRAIAQATNYETGDLKRAVAYTPFLEVIESAIFNRLITSVEIETGSPMKPVARYNIWNKVSLPYPTTFVEILDSPRLFLHYTGTDALMYTRDGELVQSWESDHIPAIFEIECSDDYEPSTVMFTDVILHDNKPLWKKTYCERKSFLTSFYKQRAKPHGRKTDSVAVFREVIGNLKPGQSVRLLDDVPYYDDDFIGGCILYQQSFKMPLLITHINEDTLGIRIRLAAMDGHTPVYVGECRVPQDMKHEISTHLGMYMRDEWTPIDDKGCIIIVSCVSMQNYEGNYHLENPRLLHIESSMGFSDTIQLADVYAITMKEY
jgi:hypothetical protein